MRLTCRADARRAAGERNLSARSRACSVDWFCAWPMNCVEPSGSVIGLMPWFRFAASPVSKSCGSKPRVERVVRDSARASRVLRATCADGPCFCAMRDRVLQRERVAPASAGACASARTAGRAQCED